MVGDPGLAAHERSGPDPHRAGEPRLRRDEDAWTDVDVVPNVDVRVELGPRPIRVWREDAAGVHGGERADLDVVLDDDAAAVRNTQRLAAVSDESEARATDDRAITNDGSRPEPRARVQDGVRADATCSPMTTLAWITAKGPTATVGGTIAPGSTNARSRWSITGLLLSNEATTKSGAGCTHARSGGTLPASSGVIRSTASDQTAGAT